MGFCNGLCFYSYTKPFCLWLISFFSLIQVIMTVIKYIPQALMNYRSKSTKGLSIGNIFLDLLRGVTKYAQMATQSIDQREHLGEFLQEKRKGRFLLGENHKLLPIRVKGVQFDKNYLHSSTELVIHQSKEANVFTRGGPLDIRENN